MSESAVTISEATNVFRESRFVTSPPSRTAEIGGIRVALIAGTMLAISVISVPTVSETITVRGAKTIPRARQVEVERPHQRDEPDREPHARGEPDERGDEAL